MDELHILARLSRHFSTLQKAGKRTNIFCGGLWCSTALMTGILFNLHLPGNGFAADLTIDDGSTVVAESPLNVGSLAINNGHLQVVGTGAMVGGHVVVGSGAGAVATVTVTGEGASLGAQETHIGLGAGSGAVVIKDDATADLGLAVIGEGAGSSGALLVSGAKVRAQRLTVGLDGGEGVVMIDSGGELLVANGMAICRTSFDRSKGVVVVSGLGSKLDSGVASLRVGESGDGELHIVGGGEARASYVDIGEGATGSGVVSVSGPGSLLSVISEIYLGGDGTGVLTLSDGGLARAGQLIVGFPTRPGITSDSKGTVNIGSASGDAATGAGRLDVSRLVFGDGEGALVFNHTDENYDFSTTVEGGGTILQEAGYTRLTGDFSSFTGLADTRGGVLAIDTDFGQAVTVKQGATLAGNGSVGDVVFEDGSQFEVDLGDEFLNTTSLTIGKDVVVKVSADEGTSISHGKVYTIIDWSDTPVEGEFTGVIGVDKDFTFLYPLLEQMENSIAMKFARNDVSFSDVALTRNQKATAEGIETLRSGEIYDAVASSSATAARMGFDQMSGEVHASVMSGQLADSAVIRSALNDRMMAVSDPVANKSLAHEQQQASSETLGSLRHWGTVLDGQGDFDTDGNAAELVTTNDGFLVGADAIYDEWLFGAAAGFSHSMYIVSDRSSSVDSDNFHFALYGAREMGRASVRAGFAYGFHQVATERNVSFAGLDQHLISDYDIHSLQGFGEVGYRIDTAIATFEPFIGFAANVSASQGYQETGGSAALKGQTEVDTSSLVAIGLRTDRAITVLGQDVLLHGSIAWQHAVGKRDTSVTHQFAGGADFTVYGVPLSSTSAVIEAGVRLPVSQQATLGVVYRGAFGADSDDQSFNTRLDVRF